MTCVKGLQSTSTQYIKFSFLQENQTSEKSSPNENMIQPHNGMSRGNAGVYVL